MQFHFEMTAALIEHWLDNVDGNDADYGYVDATLIRARRGNISIACSRCAGLLSLLCARGAATQCLTAPVMYGGESSSCFSQLLQGD